MTNATQNKQPLQGPKTYRSQHNPQSVWQLWSQGRGERTIEHFYQGVQTTLCRVYAKQTWNAATQRTVVTWVTLQLDANHKLGEYKSPEAAFAAFTKAN